MSEINIAKPLVGEEEIEEVGRVIRSGMIASGPETKKFEEEFARFVGCNYACAVNNGTSALSLALSAIGISPGDEVITSPLTFVATANSILSCGGIPVFADISEDVSDIQGSTNTNYASCVLSCNSAKAVGNLDLFDSESCSELLSCDLES